MNKVFIGSAIALALTSTHPAAGPIQTQADIAGIGMAHAEQIWLVQGNNSNGSGNGKADKRNLGNAGNGKAQARNGKAMADKGNEQATKGKGKPEHAGGPKFEPNRKRVEHPSRGNSKGARGLRAFTTAEREEIFSRIVSTPAPTGRDMRHVLGATSLALATPRLLGRNRPGARSHRRSWAEGGSAPQGRKAQQTRQHQTRAGGHWYRRRIGLGDLELDEPALLCAVPVQRRDCGARVDSAEKVAPGRRGRGKGRAEGKT